MKAGPQAFLTLLLLIATACQPGDQRLEELRALPEEHLFYPATEEISRLGAPAANTPEGSVAAFSGYRLGTQDGAEAVEVFYARELAERGWEAAPGAVGAPATSELSARAWERDGLTFRLSIRRKDDPRGPSPEVAAQYETIFDIVIIDKPAG